MIQSNRLALACVLVTFMLFSLCATAIDAAGTPPYLFVASADTNSVKRYDALTGAFLGDFVPTGSGGLSFPEGLTFGPDGHLYVVSTGSGAVNRYNGATGAFIDIFASGGGMCCPIYAIFGPDGNLYVGTGNNDAVKRFNGVTGAFMDDFIASGVDNPAGLRFGPDGHLYVANYYLNKISRFNGVTGVFIDDFVPAGSGGLTLPNTLTFGPDGRLYVSDLTNVKRYDGTTGTFLGIFASGAGLTNPADLTFGPDDNLYVTNLNEVKRYDGVTGAFIDNFISAGSGGLSGGYWLTFSPPMPVPDISGCIQLQGTPLVGRNVTLRQEGIKLEFRRKRKLTQTTTTDARGCYKFDEAVSGRKFEIIISGPVVPFD